VLAQVAGALAAGASVALGWRLGYRRDWRRLVPAALAGAPRASTLTRKWKVTLGGTGGDLAGAGDVSYPVIAGGRVFVTVENTQTYGTHLYALNASTGAKDWSVGLAGTYGFSALAYNGRAIFALNYDGAADRVLGQHRA
jgi:outer membrane protein assembly factor BamB